MKELLTLLERNYCQSPKQLAIMLNRSEDEVVKMIEQCEKDRIIVKYQTIINWDKVGTNQVTAMIDVKITPQREVGFDAIAQRIARYPEVRSIALMSGAYDLSVTVEGANLKEIANFVSTKLSTIDGIISTTSHFMMKKYKEAGVLLNDDEEEHRLVITP